MVWAHVFLVRIALLSLSSYNMCSHAFYLCLALSSIHVLVSASHSQSSARKPFLLGFLCTTIYIFFQILLIFYPWLAVPQDSDSFRQPDLHHGMEVRLGLSKGPICPCFNWSIHVVLQYVVHLSPVRRSIDHIIIVKSEKWKPTRLAPVQCSVSCFSQHRI